MILMNDTETSNTRVCIHSGKQNHMVVYVYFDMFGILQHSSINQLNYRLMNIVQNKSNYVVLLYSKYQLKHIPHSCILNMGVKSYTHTMMVI